MILNDEQKMIQDMMRNYSQQKLKPTAALRDKTAQFPAQELKELGELGALGMTVAEEWGGRPGLCITGLGARRDRRR